MKKSKLFFMLLVLFAFGQTAWAQNSQMVYLTDINLPQSFGAVTSGSSNMGWNGDVMIYNPSVTRDGDEPELPCLPSHGMDENVSAWCGGGESVVQTTELTQGTNWFSTYLDITLEDLQYVLNAALPEAAIMTIKSKNSSCRWNGTIWRAANGFSWDVAKMYMIEVPEACELTLNGTPFNPAEHPITIAPNTSTWIGFPFSESKTFDQAIPAGFAVSGDQIKYQNANALYIGTRWRGSSGFTGFEPGKGYMYNSNASGERTLIFPTGAK